ncbi:MAG: mandelate racemase/muconate lactonizing enzyme family protein [candidate division NC10 bacterium]|nr:mandelate racemase/muconate lactonizing enzyme family protein [candidate division NC10 bacterium]
MKITDVRTHILRKAYDPEKYGASSKGWIRDRASLLVQVLTDEGIEGWGEGGQTGPPELPKVAVDVSLKPLLLGQDPFDSEVLWERMYDVTRDYGQKGTLIGAISGVDIALWDIKGKATGKPVHKLLGGAFREAVTPYAPGLYYKGARNLTDQIAILSDEARHLLSLGMRAIKMKVGFLHPHEDVRLVAAIRKVVGEDVRLMVDANHAYNAYSAIEMARALAPYDITWFEEPVLPEDIDGYVEVRAKSPIPISGGEVEFTSFGHRELIRRKAVDIIQPDTCGSGGLTECKRIAALARAFGIQYSPHVWGSVVGLAASLHLLASLPPCPPTGNPSAYYQEPVLEFDRNPSPLRDELSTPPIEFREGRVWVPQGPGLGIEINPDVLGRYRVA